MSVAAIVLAAGSSSRYGGANKLLLPFGDELVVQRAVRTVREAGIERIVVVTGHQSQVVIAALANMSCEFVHNPRHAQGEMISSIQVGLRHLVDSDMRAALIVLGDQPLLPAWIIRRLIEAFEHGCGEIVAPRFGAQRGHPVLISRKHWDEALRLPDGAPMRTLLFMHPNDLAQIVVNTDAVLRDVDTPELYAEALQLAPPHPGPLPEGEGVTTDPNTARSLRANPNRG